jgi:hypothetical protein
MSRLSDLQSRMELAEKNFETYLKNNYDLTDRQIKILLLEIKEGAFRHRTPSEIWEEALGVENYKAPNGIPKINIENLCYAWRGLRAAEQEALLAWKNL